MSDFQIQTDVADAAEEPSTSSSYVEKCYSPSTVNTYMTCPYLFFLQKIAGVGMRVEKPALSLGSAIHEALAFYEKGDNIDIAIQKARLFEADEERGGICATRLREYVSTYNPDPLSYDPNLVEIHGRVELPAGYVGVFILDAVVGFEGKRYILDHKSSRAISANWASSFSLCTTLGFYDIAGSMLYDNFGGYIINGISTAAKPTIKFIRIPFRKSALDRSVFLSNYISILEDIEISIETFRFPQHTSSCGMYAGCAYRDICLYHDIDMARYVREWPPRFLEGVDASELANMKEKIDILIGGKRDE